MKHALSLILSLLLAMAGLASCGGASAPDAPSAVTPVTPPSSTASSPATSASAPSSTASSPTSGTGSAGTAFTGSVILGSPTGTSIRANVYSSTQSGQVYLAWGTTAGNYPQRTDTQTLVADRPLEFELTGLAPDTLYRYRLVFQAAGSSSVSEGAEASFQTARSAGRTFTFTLQGDSHPERAKTMFDESLYARTLAAVAADRPDFHILMGDDFSVDTLDPTTINAAAVRGRYTLQRPWLGAVGRSAPLYLVNGNHEQAARYLLDGTPNNIAVWAQNARNSLYPQPGPDTFYSGNPEQVPFIGLLRNHYAWTWGDALFVVIDPYWSSPVAVDEPFGGGTKAANPWLITHGDPQYLWLKKTLEQSTARHKFVFAHHVMGTGRGGVEVASLWEWGGLDDKGRNLLAAQRPTWTASIHELMVRNGVKIFFQGHDHVWARQQLDGVTYQTLSVPADPNYGLGFASSYKQGNVLPSSGYTRVTVSPASVKVEYVRMWLPADETATQKSGSVAFSYTVP